MAVETRLLIASERVIHSRSSPSPNGKKIMVASGHGFMMLDLPSLSKRIGIFSPDGAGSGEDWSNQCMSWTSDNQPIAVWRRDTSLTLAVYTAHDASLASLHEVNQNLLPVDGHMSAARMAVAPGQPYVAITYTDGVGEHRGNAASILNLETGQVHTLSRKRGERCNPTVECHWASSGHAMVLSYPIGTGMVRVVNVWHAPSASFLAPEPMPDLSHSWSPNGDICVLTRRSSIVMVLHIIATGIQVLEAPLGELVPPPRAPDVMPIYVSGVGLSALPCSFSFSPCSRAVVASGGDCRGPLFIKQWRLMLQQGRCEHMPLLPGPGQHLQVGWPRIRWYPVAQHACVFALLADPYAVHIRHGAQADLVASVPMLSDPGAVQELLWAPDGMQLAYSMNCKQIQRLRILNFHS